MARYLATRECGIFTHAFNIPKNLRGTQEQYLHEEKVVAINGLLFNYAMGLFPPDVVSSINDKLTQHDLPRLDGNKYGAIDKGFVIKLADKEIKLNHPLGLCEAYAAWRYAKFTHTDNNFLDHAIAACCMRGIRHENDPMFTHREGNFSGGNFYIAEYGILLKMTGSYIYIEIFTTRLIIFNFII